MWKVVIFLLIMLTTVDAEHLASVVSDKERELHRRLKPFEVECLETQLLQIQLKELPSATKKTHSFKIELKAATDKIARFKRKANFKDEILIPKKAPRTDAQRRQMVIILISMLLTLLMVLMMMFMDMLSSMFQSRAAESEEQREGRLAHRREVRLKMVKLFIMMMMMFRHGRLSRRSRGRDGLLR